MNTNNTKFKTISRSISALLLTLPLLTLTLTAPKEALASTNLLTNGDAETGNFSGWTKVDGGDGWRIADTVDDAAQVHGGTYSFVSSYNWGTLSQEVDLEASGYSATAMDTQPTISASTWVIAFGHGCNTSNYQVKVILRDSNHNAIETFDTGEVQIDENWTEVSHTFTNYGTGVRYIFFQLRGIDDCFWAGQYGAVFDDSSLTIDLPTYSLNYTAGTGGSVTGSTSQTVNAYGTGTAITAVPNSGFQFRNWSDGSTANPRTDSIVTANKSLTANFDGTGGGSPAIAPKALESNELNFTINNGEPSTVSPNLNIKLNADPQIVKGYALSLDPNFQVDSIMPYSDNFSFTLPDKPGDYTLYLKYYSTTGHTSPVISKSITYNPKSTGKVLGLDTIKPFQFERNLTLGSTGEDVKQLQIFLNSKGYLLATEGPGSPGNETSYFGTKLKNALIKFQQDHAQHILTPLGLSKGTGIFHNNTRNYINSLPR